jgi:TonB family protein
MNHHLFPSALRLGALALALAGCAQTAERYPRRDFNDLVLEETCRRYVTRAAVASIPEEARQRHLSGYVVVGYDLDGSGKARNVRVLYAKPAGVFDAAAVQAIRETQFDPEVQLRDCHSSLDFLAR